MARETIKRPSGQQKIYLNKFVKEFREAKKRGAHDTLTKMCQEITTLYTFVERNYIYKELRNAR